MTRLAPQWYLLGPILFSNDLEKVMDCMFMKFPDDTKLEGAIDTREGRAAIQRDLDRLEEWVNRNPTKFYRNKCNILCLGGKNPPAVIQAGGWGAALQECPGHLGRQQAEHEPALCPGSDDS